MGKLVTIDRDYIRNAVVIEPYSGCWLWIGSWNKDGYAAHYVRESDGNVRNRPMHRVSYELFNGPIPQGLVIDHKCRVRCCINPAHLEPVTNRVNVLRGDCGKTHAERAAKRTHCERGHEWIAENIIVRIRVRPGRNDCISRVCRMCKKTSSDARPRKTARRVRR